MAAPHGSFVPFELTFEGKTADEQARAILSEAKALIDAGAHGVGITYSANLGQTQLIRQTYADGGWNTRTGGDNQASVMAAMETLEAGEFSDLQTAMRIVPITTMNYGDFPDGATMNDVIVDDLDAIRELIADGWTILGWINEPGSDNYAVGGGIAKQYYVDHPDKAISPTQSALIQAELSRLALVSG